MTEQRNLSIKVDIAIVKLEASRAGVDQKSQIAIWEVGDMFDANSEKDRRVI